MKYGKYQALTPQEASKVYFIEFNAWTKLFGNLIIVPFPRAPLGVVGLEGYKKIFPKGQFVHTSRRGDKWREVLLVLIEV